MKLIIDIPNSLYANLKAIKEGTSACKRILECVKNGHRIEEPIILTDEQITEMYETGYISTKEEYKDGND